MCLPVCATFQAYKSTVSSKLKYAGKRIMMCHNPAVCSNQEKVQYQVLINQEIWGSKDILRWNLSCFFLKV